MAATVAPSPAGRARTQHVRTADRHGRGPGTLNLHYLAHLGRLGRTDVHPGGMCASDVLLRELDPRDGDHVLELGCGSGGSLVRLLSARGVHATAVDGTPAMLRSARLRLWLTGLARRARLVCCDFTRGLPLPSERFDRVYAESVVAFQEPDDVRRLLGELLRILRPGGRLALLEAVWAEGQDPAAIAAENDAAVASFGLRPAPVEPWTITDWHRLCAAAGFRHVRARRLPARLPAPMVNNALRVSSAVSRGLARVARLSSSVRHADAAYRAALGTSSLDGPQMESMLLVADKPAFHQTGGTP